MGLYAEWPLIEFFPLNNYQSSLSIFSKKTGDGIAELLLHEIGENLNGRVCLKIDTEEQLSWVLQVMSYALTLSHSTSKEHEALCVAVHTYCEWLNALSKDTVQTQLPGPMKRDPGSYICILLDSLRTLFVRKNIGSETPMTAIQQAHEIENVLRAVVQSLLNCDGRHKDITWRAVLKFLLNATDLLLSGQTCVDDVTSIMAPNVTKTLLDVFLCAARLEQIPSPMYWKTLSFLSKRWRHQVSFIENWARKVVSLSVIIVQKIYGERYCPIAITDEQVQLFVSNSKKTTENDTLPMLHVCWFQLMHMIGNPASIISFEPRSTSAMPLNVLSAMIATGGAMDSDGNPLAAKFDEELTEFTISSLKRCFFMTSVAVMKLVDIFYGDSRVSIDFRESDELIQHWSDLNHSACEDWLRNQQALSRSSNSSIGMNGDNATLTAAQSAMVMNGGNSVGTKNTLNVPSVSKSRTTSERSLITNISMSSPAASFVEEISPKIPKPNSAQFVWHYLQRNKIHKPYRSERQPKLARMLEIFMDWLAQSSLVRYLRSSSNHANSQRSVSCVSTTKVSSYLYERMAATGSTENNGGSSVVASANESAVSRRSFAYSTTSSDAHSGLSYSNEWPEVDGVSAGRAAALGALCRIICSKKSKETITDSQLAQFYKVVYETLLEKDRLMLCALIYFGGGIFRLALKSVEIFLPQFVQALEMIYKESMKSRLHPSIDEVQMRRACLKALSSIISWPTTFGNMLISDLSNPHSNTDENLFTYIEVRPQMHQILITALRNEVDPMNLFLILTMCTILCEESCLYDLHITNEKNVEQEKNRRKNIPKNLKEECCISIVRSVASAVCENLCKPQWSSELSVCLAALDCLNALSTLHQSVLFNENDMSIGFLIITSLCRFIDTQLMKPPPLHSKDLHSSVVAAYFSLSVWLCAAPLLLETESCLTTVAETIELGLTGGKNLPPLERKAASKRVDDAAENLLYMIFSALGHAKQDIMDEKKLLYKFGSQMIDITKFKYFLIRQQTLLSIHEATKLSVISKGFPSIFLVLRSPYHVAYTLFVQLQSWAAAGTSTITDNKENIHFQNGVETSDPKNAAKFFRIPFEFGKSYCKLDSIIPPLQPTPDTDRVIAELTEIRKRMSQGESSLRSSDDRNVWLREPLSKELSEFSQPMEPPTNCNAGRVLLYDLGLISEESYKSGDIVLLDSSNHNFYHDLHQMVDRSPTKLLQTVRLFYVRDGQRNAVDILANAMNLQNTSNLFCGLLAELGEGVEVETHPHWTGDWTTAFSAERKPKGSGRDLDNYIIDGFTHCLWWTDSHIEIAFTTPTERIRKQETCAANCDLLANTDTSVSNEHIDLDNVAKMLQHDFDSRALSQSFSDERSVGQTIGNSSGQSNKLPESFLSPHSKSHSGVDSDDEIKENGSERITFVKRNSDQRIYVVFLERIEDMYYFPYEEMFPMTTDDSLCSGENNARPDLIVIFISEVENKLVRINIIGDWTKCGLPGPLIDGCLVSSDALPNLLKHTIVSIARRRTVELENYQLVASKRRNAIQEFARKYAIKKSYCDFVELLLNE